MNRLLFVYGTLHPDRAPDEIKSAVDRMIPIAQGTIAGTLYNLGEYPGLTLDAATKHEVRGTVFELPDGEQFLDKLDDYEGYLPSDPANSLFIRSEQLIALDDGTERLCWVYLYNRKLPVTSQLPQPAADRT